MPSFGNNNLLTALNMSKHDPAFNSPNKARPEADDLYRPFLPESKDYPHYVDPHQANSLNKINPEKTEGVFSPLMPGTLPPEHKDYPHYVDPHQANSLNKINPEKTEGVFSPLSSDNPQPEIKQYPPNANSSLKDTPRPGALGDVWNRFRGLGAGHQLATAGGLGLAGAGLANILGAGHGKDEEEDNWWTHRLTGPALLAGGLGLGAYGATGGDPMRVLDPGFWKPAMANNFSSVPYQTSPGSTSAHKYQGTLNPVAAMSGPSPSVKSAPNVSDASKVLMPKISSIIDISPFCGSFLKKCVELGMSRNQVKQAIQQSIEIDPAIYSAWDDLFKTAAADFSVTGLKPNVAPTVPPQITPTDYPSTPALKPGTPAPAAVKPELGGVTGRAADVVNRISSWLPGATEAPPVKPTAALTPAAAARPVTTSGTPIPASTASTQTPAQTPAQTPGATGAPASPQQGGSVFGRLGTWWSALPDNTKMQLILGLGLGAGGLTGLGGQLSTPLALLGAGMLGHGLTGHMPWESGFYSGIMSPSTYGQHAMLPHLANTVQTRGFNALPPGVRQHIEQQYYEPTMRTAREVAQMVGSNPYVRSVRDNLGQLQNANQTASTVTNYLGQLPSQLRRMLPLASNQ